MCILIVTTAHPQYPLILLSNRDEFIKRPTAPAEWWQAPSQEPSKLDGKEIGQSPSSPKANDSHADQVNHRPLVLSGRDLRHSSHGTWLGITRTGRLAVLTNFRVEHQGREPGRESARDVQAHSNPVDEKGEQLADHGIARSRGEIPKTYLLEQRPATEWANRFVRELQEGRTGPWADVPPFNLFFATLGKSPSEIKAGILSNASKDKENVVWLRDETKSEAITRALSNSYFGDRSWPKVIKGESLLASLATGSGAEDIEMLLERCFQILSTNDMPERKLGEPFAKYSRQLRNSIFIPEIQTEEPDGTYATQKQTVLVLDSSGKVIFVERSLFNYTADSISPQVEDRRFEFEIQDCSMCRQFQPHRVPEPSHRATVYLQNDVVVHGCVGSQSAHRTVVNV